MGVITTGQTFASGDQVTSTKLNDIANQATFTSAADTTDNSTLTLSGSGKLKVADDGIGSTQLASDAAIDANRAIETNHIKDGQVTSAKLASSAVTALVPAGLIFPYAASAAPSGYLVCDGSAVSRTTYATLFTLIGVTYGSGDGGTTFNIPDLRGRVIAGHDIAVGGSLADRLTGLTGGVDSDTIGNTGGDEKHALTEAQMPKHYHEMRGPNAVTAPQGGETTGTGVYGGGTADDTPEDYATFSTGGSASSGSSSTGTSNGNGHNNVQPTMILNYIIKT